MADSPILKIPLLSVSQANKEQTINTMVSYLERSMNDAQTINLGPSNFVITDTDFARYFMWRLAGVVSGRSITIPAMKRLFVVENLTGAFTVDLVRGASTLTVPVGGVLVVYSDGVNLISVADSTVMGGGGGSVTAFVSLIDTFSSYAGQAGKLVRINVAEDGLEPSGLKMEELSDVNTSGLLAGNVLVWDDVNSLWIPADVSGGGGGSTGNSAIKIPVDVATELAHTIADDIVVGNVIDGITLTENMRVLVKEQVDNLENGIYSVTSTVPTRSSDADGVGDFYEGTLIYVKTGIQFGDKFFVQTEPDPPGGITPGASPLTFGPISLGSLSGLSDVNVSGVVDGDALIWDATTSRWIPGAAGAAYPDMTGNAGKVLTVNATEDDVEWGAGGGGGGSIPVLSVYIPGALGVDETVFRWTVPAGITVTLPVNLTGSKFTAGTGSTGTPVLTMYKDAVSIGTITFNASAAGTVVFTSEVEFTENSTLSVVADSSPDSTLADISLTFKGA